MYVGVATKDLGLVLELTGGFAATFLGFIMPAACYLKVEGNLFEWGTNTGTEKMCALFILAFGIFAMITTTSLTLQRALKNT